MTADEHDSLKKDMHALAQESILRCFSDLFRLRVAAQSDIQRVTTLLIMETSLADALKLHETQNHLGPATELSGLRASLFHSAFDEIAATMMGIVGCGLTEAESAVLRSKE